MTESEVQELTNQNEVQELTKSLIDKKYNNFDEYVEETSVLPEDSNTEEKIERISKLPLARIKHIMKLDPEVNLASADAVFLISKSTELFIQTLSKEAHAFTLQGKKKTIQKKDVESAVTNSDCLVFLDGAIDF